MIIQQDRGWKYVDVNFFLLSVILTEKILWVKSKEFLIQKVFQPLSKVCEELRLCICLSTLNVDEERLVLNKTLDIIEEFPKITLLELDIGVPDIRGYEHYEKFFLGKFFRYGNFFNQFIIFLVSGIIFFNVIGRFEKTLFFMLWFYATKLLLLLSIFKLFDLRESHQVHDLLFFMLFCKEQKFFQCGLIGTFWLLTLRLFHFSVDFVILSYLSKKRFFNLRSNVLISVSSVCC